MLSLSGHYILYAISLQWYGQGFFHILYIFKQFYSEICFELQVFFLLEQFYLHVLMIYWLAESVSKFYFIMSLYPLPALHKSIVSNLRFTLNVLEPCFSTLQSKHPLQLCTISFTADGVCERMLFLRSPMHQIF